jgi:dolichyl-phosphate beta-glucosyltransferase
MPTSTSTGTERLFSPIVSVVIPAFNEEGRLSTTLPAVREHLSNRFSDGRWEIVVCDDGSTDRTLAVAESFSDESGRVRVLPLAHRGKGATVRSGVLDARGELILFSDADLATPITESDQLFDALRSGADVAIGSRAAVGAKRLDEPFYRELMGWVFHSAVQILLLGEFADTQCGFKAFRRHVAHDLFSRLTLYNDDSPVITKPAVTGFDLEVLFLACRLNYRVEEIPVQWHYRPGSKVNPFRDSFELFRDVLRVRLNDRRGVYDFPESRQALVGTEATIDRLPGLKDDTHVI